jgi:hypothetical protein
MTIRRLGILQWLGLIAGAATWWAQHVVGFGITQAECSSGGASWGIGNDVWQIALLVASALLILAAEAASVAVFLRTRETSYAEDPPPLSRMQFFAIAAMVANAIFLAIVLLDGLASIFNVVCRQG